MRVRGAKIGGSLAIIAALVAFAGCAQQQILAFSLLSTRSVDPRQFGSFERGGIQAEGSDTMRIVVIAPIGTLDVRTAVDAAIASTPGCVALLDGTINSEIAGVPFIYMEQRIVVKGYPLIDPSRGSVPKAPTPEPLPTR